MIAARIYTALSTLDTALHRLRYRLDLQDESRARVSGVRPRYIGAVARNHRRWGGWSWSRAMCDVWKIEGGEIDEK